MRPICIYHGNCADGFTAAWIVHKRFGDGVDFYAAHHGDDPPDVTNRDVIMVDFSYKRSVIDDMAETAASMLILDHHKTAQAEMVGIIIPSGGYHPAFWRDEDYSTGGFAMRAIFDMDRSGAQIAWDYFFPNKTRHRLVDYVGDRDLWKFELPSSRAVSSYIFSYEYTFDAWDDLSLDIAHSHYLDTCVERGEAIERKHMKDVREMVAASCRTMHIGGYFVPVANLPYTMSSEAGNLMAQGKPFAVTYFDMPKGRVFSLRSAPDGVDVSEIAKMYGGGGHKHAAGFQRPLGWEGDMLDELILAYDEVV